MPIIKNEEYRNDTRMMMYHGNIKPGTMVIQDMDIIGYDRESGKPLYMLENKHCNAGAIDLSDPKYRTHSYIADACKVPFFINVYRLKGDESLCGTETNLTQFKIIPVNTFATKALKDFKPEQHFAGWFSELEYCTFFAAFHGGTLTPEEQKALTSHVVEGKAELGKYPFIRK